MRSSLLQVQVKGLTGPLRLDDKGLRTDFSMNVIELKSTGFEKVSTIIVALLTGLAKLDCPLSRVGLTLCWWCCPQGKLKVFKRIV